MKQEGARLGAWRPWGAEAPRAPASPAPGRREGIRTGPAEAAPRPQLPAEGGTGLELGCGRRAGGSLGTSTRDDQGHSGADVAGPSVRQSRRDARGQPGLGHPSRLCPHEGPTAVWQGAPGAVERQLQPRPTH